MTTDNRYQEEEPITHIVSEPTVVYEVKSEVNEYREKKSRNDIHSAIDGEELLNRLRPRIKSLFE
ncbi:MAG: hypothetical protein J6C92_04800 [Bacteroidaceae bacterium]|nr:hypothetical protein [Bacteroidaceae bacterium]